MRPTTAVSPCAETLYWYKILRRFLETQSLLSKPKVRTPPNSTTKRTNASKRSEVPSNIIGIYQGTRSCVSTAKHISACLKPALRPQDPRCTAVSTKKRPKDNTAALLQTAVMCVYDCRTGSMLHRARRLSYGRAGRVIALLSQQCRRSKREKPEPVSLADLYLCKSYI